MVPLHNRLHKCSVLAASPIFGMLSLSPVDLATRAYYLDNVYVIANLALKSYYYRYC